MSLALHLVTQLQKTKGTVVQETGGGLCRLHFGAEAFFLLLPEAGLTTKASLEPPILGSHAYKLLSATFDAFIPA